MVPLDAVKTYGQYCAVARGLDVVGDRWTLLIARELLDGPRRYGELRAGLPGVATNLLGDRLKGLVDAGVVEHDGDHYALTAWGAGLRDVIYAVGRWGMPLMARPPGDDEFHTSWLRHLVGIHLAGTDRSRRDGVVELRCDGDDEVLTLVTDAGRVTATMGSSGPEPDVVLSGPPDGVGGLVTGFLTVADATARGVSIDGDVGRLPLAPSA